jgi:hypothetical protein
MSLFAQCVGRNAQSFAQFACKTFGEKSKNHPIISMLIAQRYARPYMRRYTLFESQSSLFCRAVAVVVNTLFLVFCEFVNRVNGVKCK